MSKRKIIILSVIFALLAILIVFFCSVTRLRNQKVIFDAEVGIDAEDIIKSADLKNNQFIFMIDKEKAIDKLETAYPKIKVVQIRTTGVMSIEIEIDERVPVYFYENEGFFILDKDCKVIDKQDEKPNLIEIKAELGELKLSQFIVGKKYLKSLYESIYCNIIDLETNEFVAENKFSENILYIDILKGYTLTKSYDRLILMTKYGCSFDIAEPNNDLTRKVNLCYSALKTLYDNDENFRTTSNLLGVIKLSLDKNNVEKLVYIENN